MEVVASTEMFTSDEDVGHGALVSDVFKGILSPDSIALFVELVHPRWWLDVFKYIKSVPAERTVCLGKDNYRGAPNLRLNLFKE